MIGGYVGKILFVDLTQGSLSEEVPDEGLYMDYIGGYGLGDRVLFTRQAAGTDPLGPEAVLGFFTGPLTGTPALFGSRYVVVGKSPLTGTLGDANSGGDFGPYLKFAGYDAVFLNGISSDPVYLFINDGAAELRRADQLWGRDTEETESLLRAELGREIRVASIGPSGERTSLISCIINDRGRAAGRSGLGAVMGSKRLKAIVVKGKQPVPLAREAELKAARTKHLGQLGGMVSVFRDFGTCGAMAQLVMIGDAPVKNWGGTAEDFPNAAAISDQNLISLQESKYGCWRCPVSCGGLMKAGKGRHSYRAGVHKPEYETLAAFGSMCLNDNVESIIKANDICNRYGLDTISAGATIAWAIECYENGIISNADTDGLELRWGDHEAIIEMTGRLARREGFGEVLADGVRKAAEQIGRGAEELAIHIHGQEVPMHDPKRFANFTTAYFEATPARHTQGSYGYSPASGLEFPAFDRKSMSGRGEANKMGSDLLHVINCAGLCLLGYGFMDFSAIPEFLNSATGWNLGLEDLLKIGERVANLRQAFNAREGISIRDFKFPGRVQGRPPLKVGPTAGRTAEIEPMLRDYLAVRDWDPVSGKPSRKKLLELGLTDAAEALWGQEA